MLQYIPDNGYFVSNWPVEQLISQATRQLNNWPFTDKNINDMNIKKKRKKFNNTALSLFGLLMTWRIQVILTFQIFATIGTKRVLITVNSRGWYKDFCLNSSIVRSYFSKDIFRNINVILSFKHHCCFQLGTSLCKFSSVQIIHLFSIPLHTNALVLNYTTISINT